VDRWLLNTFPFWAMVVLFVGVAMTIGVGGFHLMRRFVPSLAKNADSRSLSTAFSISSGLFSFVLAFTIGQLYSNFTRASSDARTEGTDIAQVLRSAQGLPPVLGRKIRAETLAYDAEVRTYEWRLMARGGSSVTAWEDIDQIYRTLEQSEAVSKSDPFYGDTVSNLNQLVLARRTRLDDVNLSLPPLFQALLLIGAVLAISSTFYFKPFGEPIQLVMIGAASALVGIALLVAVQLDYPYSGSIAVSSAPFKPSTIILLAGH
jgi:Protein of unknown function (DUF4239)